MDVNFCLCLGNKFTHSFYWSCLELNTIWWLRLHYQHTFVNPESCLRATHTARMPRPTFGQRPPTESEELDSHWDDDVPFFFPCRNPRIRTLTVISFKSSVCLLQFLWFVSSATSQIMCAFFHVSAISEMQFSFPRRMVPYQMTCRGEKRWDMKMEHNANQGLQCVQGVWHTARGIPTQDKGKQSTRFDVTMILLCFVYHPLSLWEKKKLLAFWFFFFFPPHLNSLFYQYSVTGQFHFEHDRNAFPFCWKISAFQTVVIVWHSVVGGHVMVCVAQPLGLLVRTYKIVFIWARTFLLTIKQPSSYKMCQLILLRNKIK